MAFHVLKQKLLEANKGFREVRVSDSGIVVVEDTLPDGSVRHTRVLIDGRYAQVVSTSPSAAWKAARKAVA